MYVAIPIRSSLCQLCYVINLCLQFTNQAFTISGWEIDRQLDGLVDSLAVGGDAEGNQEGLEGLLEPLAA